MNSTALSIQVYGLNISSIISTKVDIRDTFNLNVRGVDLSVNYNTVSFTCENLDKIIKVCEGCTLRVIDANGKSENYNLKDILNIMQLAIIPEKRLDNWETTKYNLNNVITISLDYYKVLENDEGLTFDPYYDVSIKYLEESKYKFNIKDLNNAFRYK